MLHAACALNLPWLAVFDHRHVFDVACVADAYGLRLEWHDAVCHVLVALCLVPCAAAASCAVHRLAVSTACAHELVGLFPFVRGLWRMASGSRLVLCLSSAFPLVLTLPPALSCASPLSFHSCAVFFLLLCVCVFVPVCVCGGGVISDRAKWGDMGGVQLCAGSPRLCCPTYAGILLFSVLALLVQPSLLHPSLVCV